MKNRNLIYLCLFTSFLYTFGSDSIPFHLEMVKKHILEKEYLEKFGDVTYRLQLNDYAIDDFENDGIIEVILNVNPHYLQSPTILFYQVFKDNSVKRLIEGLAPGKLKKRTDKFLDSHTTGMALDLTIEGKKTEKEKSIEDIFFTSLKIKPACMVFYESFIHMDYREGIGTFIDMTHIDNIPGNKLTCEGFEFYQIKDIETGIKDTKSNKKHLFVLIDNELFVYTINNFKENGLIDKDFTIEKLKYSSVSLLKNVNNDVRVIDKKGKPHKIN